MKVMLLAHGLGVGGAEMMICHLARHLRASGTAVEIGCLGELGALGEEMRADGFEVTFHERHRGFDRTLPLRLARRLRRWECDVIHAHQRTGFFYGLLAGLVAATPLVYTEHAPLFGEVPTRRKKAFNRLFGRRARRITAVAECVRRPLREVEGFDKDVIEIVPNAVDLGRFGHTTPEVARARTGLPPDARIVGTIGRLAVVKNQRMLLHMLALVRARIPNVVLVLIGQGAERPRLEALAREIGVADHVRFLGARRDVEDILPAFDVFCLSSLSEGVPLTLLEAMAARVPVVATTVGGIPEAARPDREALLLNGTPPDCRAPLSESGERYIAQFAGAVERVLRDDGLRRDMTEHAYQRVTREYSTDIVCRRYASILAAAADRWGTPSPEPCDPRGSSAARVR